MSMPRTCAIIINYKNVKYTAKCVSSLKASTASLNIVVVDNTPFDPALGNALAMYPEVKLIYAQSNLGFGRGNNMGIEWALANTKCEFILLLNNDAFIERNALLHLENSLDEHPEAGITAPKIVFAHDPAVLWYGGGEIDWKRGGAKAPGIYGQSNAVLADTARDVTFASGCAMLIRRELLEEIGLFNEQFFMYEEDLELCLRAAEHGYRIRYEPEAMVKHVVQGSLNEGEHRDLLSPANPNSSFYIYHTVRNRLLNMNLHAKGKNRVKFMIGFPLLLTKMIVRCAIHGRWDCIASMREGWIYYRKESKRVKEVIRDVKNRSLPNFIIVGAPKCGTTSLYHYLQQHPDIFMCPIKEPNYFSCEETENQKLYYRSVRIRSLKEYKALFTGVNNEKAVGEASVSYLYYYSVPNKIKSVIPDAKVIVMLRNPVERAFSHYLMDLRLGYVNISFDDIISKKSTHRNQDLYYQQYVSLGLYYDQVKRYLDIFGKKNVAVVIFEDFKSNTVAVTKSLYSFIGVDSGFEPDVSQKINEFLMPSNKIIRILYGNYETRAVAKSLLTRSAANWIKKRLFARMKKPAMSDNVKHILNELYRPDIIKLEQLLNTDLQGWFKNNTDNPHDRNN